MCAPAARKGASPFPLQSPRWCPKSPDNAVASPPWGRETDGLRQQLLYFQGAHASPAGNAISKGQSTRIPLLSGLGGSGVTSSRAIHQSRGRREQSQPRGHHGNHGLLFALLISFHGGDGSSALLQLLLTLFLDDDPEEGVGGGQGLVVVVVVVDGQQVAVHVRVAQQHVHAGDLVHALQQAVEVLEGAHAGALDGETAKLGIELRGGRRKRRERKRRKAQRDPPPVINGALIWGQGRG